MGIKSTYGIGGLHPHPPPPTATNPGARPLSTFETKMDTRNAKRSISAILRKNKGLWIVKS